MAAVNLCVTGGPVCVWLGDSLPEQTLTFVDDAGAPVSIATASVDMTVTPVLSTVATLTYDETDTTEIDRTTNVITYQIGATDMATLTAGTYTLKIITATAAFTRTLVQQLNVKTASVA